MITLKSVLSVCGARIDNRAVTNKDLMIRSALGVSAYGYTPNYPKPKMTAKKTLGDLFKQLKN